jgi:hypothetical protein
LFFCCWPTFQGSPPPEGIDQTIFTLRVSSDVDVDVEKNRNFEDENEDELQRRNPRI